MLDEQWNIGRTPAQRRQFDREDVPSFTSCSSR
jgi:hypothetical protein